MTNRKPSRSKEYRERAGNTIASITGNAAELERVAYRQADRIAKFLAESEMPKPDPIPAVLDAYGIRDENVVEQLEQVRVRSYEEGYADAKRDEREAFKEAVRRMLEGQNSDRSSGYGLTLAVAMSIATAVLIVVWVLR